MRYYHYSENPNLIIKKYNNKNRLYGDNDDLKPSGFYFAQDAEWIEFSNVMTLDSKNKTENYNYPLEEIEKITNGKVLYRVFLKDEKDMAIISTFQELIKFDQKYKKEDGYINWEKVKQDYDGILMKNYHDVKDLTKIGTRLRDWFGSFDVNGGVVWNFDKVEICKVDIENFNKYFHEKKNLKKLKKSLQQQIDRIDEILNSF